MASIVGYGFHPTPEELINHYLRKKRLDPDCSVQKIKEVNLCNYEPSELPGLLPVQTDDQECHFFCELYCEYGKSKRVNRRTRGGNWKVTGKKRDIKDKHKRIIGWKITLVFYEGSGNSKARTNWIMHEYHIKDDSGFKREFVVVRIRRKPNTRIRRKPNTKYNAPLTPNGGVPSTDVPSNSGNHNPQTIKVESQLQQEPQPLANHEISFNNTSQLISNGGRNSQSAFDNEFYRHQTGHYHALNELEHDGRKSQSIVQSQENGHSLPTDFNLSKADTGNSFYYGSDEAITALNDESVEIIAALLKGFSSMAYEYDFNSMFQSQVYPPDENILTLSMGSVV